ncbi:MAG TPA: thiamine diphosphokinase [Candidatus Sulfomarinibacteraceae bacterium]|nr:thiamine diphosphokinase [Candidatus Sulfomarinibacteraceae bacterium]
MAVLIFANGDMLASGWLSPYLAQATMLLAADGGARHLQAIGQRPDVVIGDLDSFPAVLREEWRAASTEFVTHPEAKDETDLELALLYAAANYEDEILVFGGIGGRLDQTLANMLLLMHPQLRHRKIRYLTQYQQIWLVLDDTEIRGERGDLVSLIPLQGDVHVRSTSGLRWSLTDEVLTFGPARGLSNVMVDDIAAVSVRSGCLLCIHTSQLWER